ncbi:MAG: DUF3987 domain-containing protein [Bacteroidaceae bacterium]|nr:DUF3987 domain-containing protein [Bacteroidaceae bacterium]
MSTKIFSAPEWENVHSEQKASLPPLQTHDLHESATSLEEEIDKVVQEIEVHRVDIAPDYAMWVNVGFALADGLGENGRAVFHRISKLHPDYTPANTDKQFTNCLNSRGTGVTIATFFHYAAQAGIELHRSSNTILPNYQNGKTAKWIKPESELPHFPEEIFHALPPFLKKTVSNAISVEDRDVILLGAIGCLSACFYNVCGVYDERVVYSNLYLFVVANAGMGKGALTLCRELVVPINQRLHEQTAQRMIEYKRELAEYQKSKNKSSEAVEPVPPQQKTLMIPANSSASSLIRILYENDGIGMLFETEGDTLSQTLKSEFGNYNDILRKAAHHEKIGMSRCKDKEFFEVENPRLSVILAGTPEQVRHLIPDAENGLLSRFIFFFIPFRREIRNVFATDDVSQSKQTKFKTLGDEFLHLLDYFMNQGSFVFALPTHCQHHFVEWLTRLNDECCDEVDNGMQGIVRRLGLIAFRMMMLFTAIRAFDKSQSQTRTPDGRIILKCSEEDFKTVLCICEILLYHSVHIYLKLRPKSAQNVLPAIETGVNARRYALYHKLPNEFDKSIYDRIVSEMNENACTASKWIDKFIQDGRLKRTSKGNYVKS